MTCTPSDPCGACDLCADVDDRGNGQAAQQLYRSTRLADVQPERVRWLWPSRLPLAKPAALGGDPDVGKSTLMLDVAARVTTGRPMPGEDLACVPPSDVVIMSAEDGLADTIRPRLDAAGGDPARVHHLDAVVHDETGEGRIEQPPVIPDDTAALEALVVDKGAVLVVVDVLMAYLSGRTDSYRDQDVRRALAPLAHVAERTGASIVVIVHIPKSQRRAGSAITAFGGAMGVIGAARSGMLAAVDPDDDTGRRRILARAKGNLAPLYPSLAYQLVADESRGVARVEWLGESAHTGDTLLAPRLDETDEDRSELDEVVEWLRDVLTDRPRKRAELIKEARSEGISERTLKRAGQRVGVVSERDQLVQGRPATWSLPGYGPKVMGQTTLAHNLQGSDQGKQADSAGYGPHSDPGPKPRRSRQGDTP